MHFSRQTTNESRPATLRTKKLDHRDHSYIRSSHFWDFWTPSPPYVSMLLVLRISKTWHFLIREEFNFEHIVNFLSRYVTLWQYGLWSFQTGVTKLERFLPEKLLNFENWVNGEVSRIDHLSR